MVLALGALAGDGALAVASGAAAAVVAAATLFTASRAAWAGAVLGSARNDDRRGALATRPVERRHPARGCRAAVAGVLVTGVLLLVAATTWATARDVRVLQQRSYVDVVLHTLNLAGASRGATERPRTVLGGSRAHGEGPPLGRRRRRALLQGTLPVGTEPGRARPAPGECAQLPAAGRGRSRTPHSRGVPRAAVQRLSRRAARLLERSAHPCPPSGARECVRHRRVPRHAVHRALAAASRRPGDVLAVGGAGLSPRTRMGPRRGSLEVAPRRGRAGGAVSIVLLVTLPARLDSAITLEDVRLSGLVVDAAQEPERGDWVGARANIDVPRSARAVTVHLRFATPAAQTVAVSLDGRAVENVQGQPGQVLELRYMLPHAGPDARFRRLGTGRLADVDARRRRGRTRTGDRIGGMDTVSALYRPLHPTSARPFSRDARPRHQPQATPCGHAHRQAPMRA